MAYEVHLADSVREKLREMVRKDSLTYKRLVKKNKKEPDSHSSVLILTLPNTP